MKRITTLITALTLAIIFLLTDEALSLKILCNNAPAPALPHQAQPLIFDKTDRG
jgi:hypothetical protein